MLGTSYLARHTDHGLTQSFTERGWPYGLVFFQSVKLTADNCCVFLLFRYPPLEPFTYSDQQVKLSVSGLRGRAAQQRPKAQIESGAFRFGAKLAFSASRTSMITLGETLGFPAKINPPNPYGPIVWEDVTKVTGDLAPTGPKCHIITT